MPEIDPLALEWANLGLRWLHIIAAIAWIGTSFYFVALELSLRDPGGLPRGVGGEAWQVHGGGFYRMQKYAVAPAELPERLTWFKWEAYTTWFSGFALLLALYYWNAELYLIDPEVMDLTPTGAVLVGLGTVLGGVLVYEALCRSPLGRRDVPLALVGYALLVLVAWGYTQVFSGRGAIMHAGVLVATIMVASVANVIIPNQKRAVAALLRGETPDPRLGREARQRSLHNNYLTLPVLFTMISGHYPLVFASRWNWLILAVVFVIGFAVRHFFNERHRGHRAPWWTWGVAAAGVAAVVALASVPPGGRDEGAAAAPARPPAPVPAEATALAAAAERVVLGRCSVCHAAEPVWYGIALPPKGVALETPEEIRLHAGGIRLQAVLTHAMPPANVTGITEAERATLAAWLEGGAAAPR